ncbi:MAG: 4-(cytidine 5'-diphospho)-2-C-methyl-D-erythritol kinase [Syntrophomonadaceae bacterium]|nr:4-(cytidine 5'-diphospho)-2-C-methyl-D-erythritol kinase [Syntrophomonadaceae bacterium]
MNRKIIIAAPAKVNLTLDIKGKYPDGYHELETVMHHIDLLDQVTIETAPSGIEVASSSSLVPDNQDNLAYQAAELILKAYGSGEGVKIHIEKNIPVAAGLAGGSTDAAAVLTGINQLYNYGLTQEKLMEIGLKIGADVPFCLYHRTALARGKGELLTPLEKEVKLLFVVVKPELQISTAEVYREFDLAQVEKFPDISSFLVAWNHYNIKGIAINIVNVLESVSIKKHGEIATIKDKLNKLGALNAVMSGSGPSVFGIFADQKIAEQAAAVLSQEYREVFLVSSYNSAY